MTKYVNWQKVNAIDMRLRIRSIVYELATTESSYPLDTNTVSLRHPTAGLGLSPDFQCFYQSLMWTMASYNKSDQN